MDFITHKVKEESLIFYLAFVSLVVLFADRIFFERYLFADGACILLENFYQGVFSEIPTRSISQFLLKIPMIFSQQFHVKDLFIAEKIFALGFFIPFLISFGAIQLFKNDYKKIGYFIFFLIVSLFYIPYSFFAVGEYNLIYPLIPLIIASFFQLKDLPEDVTARIIFNISIFILILSYDVFPFFSILLLTIFFNHHHNKKKINYFIPEIGLLIISLLAILSSKFSLDAQIVTNGLKGLTEYAYRQPDGFIYDTIIYFVAAMLISTIIFFTANNKNDKKQKKSKVRIIILFVVAVFCILANTANHYPSNSYFSKTMFLLIIIFFTSFIFLFSLEKFNGFIKISLNTLIIIFLINTLFMFIKAYEFKSYLNDFKKYIEINPTPYILQDEFLLNFKDDKRFYKKRFNYFVYDWSWGHACLSQIIKPENKSYVVGHCDPNYYDLFPELIKDFKGHESKNFKC
ncbi:hypothetical protein VI34_06455 [Methylophilales bacterium MBRSG12]|uniref:Uncharacterized protein n=1 Tax=Methylophilales bacterium MBRS-H7 TaxID=1623450 RepID=A0A0H4JCU4_9PROT|nr:hypothetical protein UZ34_03870 [Methylophilales bacterium MBRSF5]AKO66302.1 hypothetical protein VI33_06465 [Methylophilales bacterium MBRS-H7]AKO67618.1 hypothetical protein VI34_06455 [Methylophilales bacterium MBRSG12]